MRPQPVQPPGMPVSKTLTPAQKAGNLVYVSGQVALNDKGEVVGKGDFTAQAQHTYENLRRVLEASGSSLRHVVKVTNFLVNPADYAAFNAVRMKVFPENPPASSTVIVKALAMPDLLVEVEAIAVVPQ